MTNEDLFDKIKAFLAEELPQEEMQAFRAEIAKNPELAEEVALSQLEIEAMDELHRKSIRDRIPQWNATIDILPPAPINSSAPAAKSDNKYLRYLGILVLLIAAGTVWFLAVKETSDAPAKAPDPIPDTIVAPPIPTTKDSITPQATPNSKPTIKKKTTPAKQNQDIPSKKAVEYAELPGLAAENLGDLYAYVDEDMVGISRGSGETTATKQLFDLARIEFAKPNRDVIQIKNNLHKIPASDKFYYPIAMKMLTEVYFKEGNYKMAVSTYEKYAAFDNSSATNWRLLNFRLAVLPRDKARFWQLLNSMAQNSDQNYQMKAKKLKNDLAAKGIVE